jgi:stage IV sporulation protein FB
MVETPIISGGSMGFKVYGISVRLDLFFILVLLLGVLGGLHVEVLALSLALIIHELAHIFTAQSLGIKVQEVRLLPFGARITLDLARATPETEILTALAGPMANFSVAIFMFLVLNQGVGIGVLNQFTSRQLQLGFFNLIPALPLDGGRIFELWLRERTNFIFASRSAAKAGKVLAGALFIISALSFGLGKLPFNLAIPAMFLYYYAVREERETALVFIKQVTQKKGRVLEKGLLSAEILVVVETTPVKRLLYLFAPQKYYIVYVVDRDMHIKKYLTETEIFDQIVLKGLEICVKDLF